MRSDTVSFANEITFYFQNNCVCGTDVCKRSKLLHVASGRHFVLEEWTNVCFSLETRCVSSRIFTVAN